jgi:hypothetical protein
MAQAHTYVHKLACFDVEDPDLGHVARDADQGVAIVSSQPGDTVEGEAMVMLFVVGGKPAYNVNSTMLVADAAAYNKLGQSAGAGRRGASQSTNMRGCADGKDWVDTRGRVGVELDVENLERLERVRACRYVPL